MAKSMFIVLVVAFCLSSVLANSYLRRRDRRLGHNLDLTSAQASASASASSNTRGGFGSSSANAQSSASASTRGDGSSSANAQSSASASTRGDGSSSANAQASAAAESVSQGNQCYDVCQQWDNNCYCSYDNLCGAFVCRRSDLPHVNPIRPRVNSIRPRVNRIRSRVPVCRRDTLSVIGRCRHFDQCQYQSECPGSQICCHDANCGYNVCQYAGYERRW